MTKIKLKPTDNPMSQGDLGRLIGKVEKKLGKIGVKLDNHFYFDHPGSGTPISLTEFYQDITIEYYFRDQEGKYTDHIEMILVYDKHEADVNTPNFKEVVDVVENTYGYHRV